MMEKQSERITWLASYPKSGNTWLRSLLFAYRNNGVVDINQLGVMGQSDAHIQYMRIVSPIDVDRLGVQGQQMLRPAMLLHQVALFPLRPFFMKTHNANVIPKGCAPLITTALTTRAIYIVRDPRDVLLSAAPFFAKTNEEMAESMNDEGFHIGAEDQHVIASQLCSWTTHVKSWATEQEFPTKIIRYEDLMTHPVELLSEILEFCGIDVDKERVQNAVWACDISNLRKQEKQQGFVEHTGGNAPRFFNKGGSRWMQELDPKLVQKIEEDHSEAMQRFGYFLTSKPVLEAV